MGDFSNDPRLEEAKALSVVDVVSRLGIESLKQMSGELIGPCPLCGGRDRFGINLTSKLFGCRKCEIKGGDTVALVQAVHGCNFKDALAWLCGERPARIDPAEVERRREIARRSQEKQDRFAEKRRREAIADAQKIWRSSVTAGHGYVRCYLSKRGIKAHMLPHIPVSLRFIADHPYEKTFGKGGRALVHTGPAMIAGIQNQAGDCVAVHQTWLDIARPNGKAAMEYRGEAVSSKLVRGSKKGCAIRLVTPKQFDTLIMGEGIETTLSAAAADLVPGAAYWAGIDLGNMSGLMERGKGMKFAGVPKLDDQRAFVPPPWIKRLIFIQDGDSEPRLTRAKLLSGLRRASHHNPGLKTQILPVKQGFDLNDLLQLKDVGPGDE